MDTDGHVREIIQQLQRPVSDIASLLALITAPLDSLGLLPPTFRRYNVNPLPQGSLRITVHIPSIQRALLDHIAPTWEVSLAEQNAVVLIFQYFCPDLFSFATPSAGQIAVLAYSTILSSSFNEYSIRLLLRLTKEYPIDRLHSAIFSQSDFSAKLHLKWEDTVQNVVALPAKVANYCGAIGKDVPSSLEQRVYFNDLCIRCEYLIYSSVSVSSRDSTPSINFLLTKLVKLGVFPSKPPTSPSQPSFFEAVLPIIRSRLTQESAAYCNAWSRIFRGFDSSFTLQNVLTSLVVSLTVPENVTDDTDSTRATVKREAQLVHNLCSLQIDDSGLQECVTAVILGREWEEGFSRIFTCWIAKSEPAKDGRSVLSVFLDDIMSLWATPDHITHSLLARHRYVTSLLLLTISYLPPSSPEMLSLALSAKFISSIGMYITHMDNSVRHCGMLVAEVVAQRAGKNLDFKDWDGDDSGKPWARSIRKLILRCDLEADSKVLDEVVPPETATETITSPVASRLQSSEPKRPTIMNTDDYDSDDSLTGYISPPSSRSSSPAPSELDEIERDPSLNVGRKKVARPVYLAQLGNMIRGMNGISNESSADDADRVEMALDCAEELIRRKKDFGTELEENAVNLAYGFAALQDNYDLQGFEVKRQNALNALVACCPRKAAPCIIEEFFKNQYSTNQRYAMLNALALGARELASLSTPPSTIPPDTTSFPSKRLPAPLHQKYIATPTTQVLPQILEGITREAIDRDMDEAPDKVPEIVRERRLRIQKPQRISEVSKATGVRTQVLVKKTSFNEVAAEFFLAPYINRFWLFLRDEHTREERTTHYEGRGKYHGAGTGLILNPVVVAHFLRTLTVLVHASQHAPEWLGVIAPDALELSVTLGTKPLSLAGNDETEEGNTEPTTRGKEASVLSSALEVALIVLDGCLELDGGRSLSLDHSALLMGTGEWAGAVFSRLEGGIKIQGGGGAEEVNLRRAASGVLLKVDDIASKWRRSMLDAW